MIVLTIVGAALVVVGFVLALVNMWRVAENEGGSFGHHLVAIGLEAAGGAALVAAGIWWVIEWMNRLRP